VPEKLEVHFLSDTVSELSSPLNGHGVAFSTSPIIISPCYEFKLLGFPNFWAGVSWLSLALAQPSD